MDVYCHISKNQNQKLKNKGAFKLLSKNYLRSVVLYPAKLSPNVIAELKYFQKHANSQNISQEATDLCVSPK